MTASIGDPRLPERFWAKVEIGAVPAHRPDLGPCWMWTAAPRGNGYGAFAVKVDGRKTVVSPHRHAYLTLVGPTSLVLDHLCRVQMCVNPAHLEPVTVPVNSARSPLVLTTINAGKTHCPRNHPYDAENTRIGQGRRHCRACQREKRADARALKETAA